jgi:hypothetical protein
MRKSFLLHTAALLVQPDATRPSSESRRRTLRATKHRNALTDVVSATVPRLIIDNAARTAAWLNARLQSVEC